MTQSVRKPSVQARGWLSFETSRSRLNLATVEGLKSSDLGVISIEQACEIATKHGVRVIKDGRIYVGWHDIAKLTT